MEEEAHHQEEADHPLVQAKEACHLETLEVLFLEAVVTDQEDQEVHQVEAEAHQVAKVAAQEVRIYRTRGGWRHHRGLQIRESPSENICGLWTAGNA